MRVLVVLRLLVVLRGSFGSPWFSGSCGSSGSLVLVVGYPVALAAGSPGKLVCLDFLVNIFLPSKFIWFIIMHEIYCCETLSISFRDEQQTLSQLRDESPYTKRSS